MPDPLLQPELTPTILDRLFDTSPGSQREASVSAWERARNFQAELARDLTALLNTRRAAADFDPVYEECANSVLTFGIIDFTSYNLKKGVEQEQLRKSIERAIRRFEPRLERVAVTLEEADQTRPVVRFQVSAVLRTEAQEPVVFEATLHRDTRRVAVSEAA
jgi:type VI secretion system protein ImpF